MKPTNKKRKASVSGGAAAAKKHKASKNTNGKPTGPKVAAKADKTGKRKPKQGANKSGNGDKSKKKKTAKPAEIVEEVEVDDDDVAFFEENAQFSSFLVKMDATRLSKGMFTKERQPRPPSKPTDTTAEKAVGDVDDIANEPLEKLEARPRRAGWQNASQIDLSSKLPVKFMDGSVRQNKLLVETVAAAKAQKDEEKARAEAEAEEQAEQEAEGELDVDDELGSDVSELEFEELQSDGEETTKPEATPVPTPVDLERQRRHRLAQKKIEIAHLGEKILESPEDALKKNKEHPQGHSKLQELHALTSDADVTVQKLALLSELSVFLDILPDYRIRLQQPEEAKAPNGRPLKKSVQQMQDYEASMLTNYQHFLKTCASLVQYGLKLYNPHRAAQTSSTSQHVQRALTVAETAARCLASLLTHKYAFNFHVNLIVALVPMADCAVPAIREAACTSFEAVFQADKTCIASLDIVKQVASYVKQKEHRVQPFIIQTFLKMPLEVTMEQGEASRKKAKADRKKRRKLQNDGDTIAAGLKEAEAVVDRREREKTQGDILHELVLVYFRILKQATYSTALPAVLEGLSKFAFLINLEIMIDLLKVLKTVLKQDVLPLAAAFQAVLTGLRTLQGPGQELMIDDKEFVDILYKLLRRFSDGEDVSCFAVALQCVEQVFLRRKEIVVDRVAAFIKRLLLVAPSLPPHQTLAVLSLVRSLVHRYAKLQQLLESDIDRVASGEYRADVDDPDFANPYASATWELSLLAKHYHPMVASYALGTAQLGPSLPNETPRAMLEGYNTTQRFAFVPCVAVPPRNPLHAKLAQQKKREQSKKRQRERKFFISDPIKDNLRQASPFWRLCQKLDQPAPVENVVFQR